MSSPRTWDCVLLPLQRIFQQNISTHPATRRRYQKLRLLSRVSSHVSSIKSPIWHLWGAHTRSQSRLQTPLPIFGKWRAKHVDRHSSRICKLATKWKRIVPDITQVSDQVIKPRICFLYKRMRNNSTPQRAPLPASLADSGQPRSLFSMLSLLSVD